MVDTWLQKIVKSIFNIKSEKQILHSVDEELIEKDTVIKNQAKQIQTLNAQLAKKSAEESKKRERKKDSEELQKTAEALNAEQSELEKIELGQLFSFNNFYRKLYGVGVDSTGKIKKSTNELQLRSKWGKKFEIADKNDKVSSPFGDFLLSSKGFFVLKDIQGTIKAIGGSSAGLLKSESIFNQMKRGRFLMAVDEDGEYVPELDNEELPELSFNFDDEKYEKLEKSKKKVREKIIELEDQLHEKNRKIELLEVVIGKLRIENSDEKRANIINEANINTMQTGTSRAINLFLQTTRENSESAVKIVNLTESKNMLEKRLDAEKVINKKLLEEIEMTGDKTAHKKAMALMREAREFERTVNLNPDAEPKAPESPKSINQ